MRSTLDRLNCLKQTIHNWLDRHERATKGLSALTHPLTNTHHLADMAFAYAKARLGDNHAAQAEHELARNSLPTSTVLNNLSDMFRQRMYEAAREIPHNSVAPMPDKNSSDWYPLRELVGGSDILNPSMTHRTTTEDLLDKDLGSAARNKNPFVSGLNNAAKTLEESHDPQAKQEALKVVEQIEPALFYKSNSDQWNNPLLKFQDPEDPKITKTANLPDVVRAYIKAIAATHDEKFIDNKLAYLFEHMSPMANNYSTAKHFSVKHYPIIEEAIRAVLNAEAGASPTARNSTTTHAIKGS